MADEKTPKTVQVEVDIPDELAMGAYCNLARVSHTATEFVLDGVFLPPQSRKAKVRARLILSPIHAKFLQAALAANIKMYEDKFGAITPPPAGSAGGGGTILH